MLKGLIHDKWLIALVIMYLLAELLVWPAGNFPLNDDWAFAKNVNILVMTGNYHMGKWPAMTLWTHVIYGAIFVYLFGFSFNVLRISTLLSSFIGAVVLYRLIKRLSGNARIAFAGTALYLFHPVYFVSANSFMTEVNFSTLFILGVSFAIRYFETGRHIFILPFFIVSALLTLLRQYGIVLPAVFLLTVILTRPKWQTLVAASVSLCLTYLILQAYEGFIKPGVPPGALYKFSGSINPFDKPINEKADEFFLRANSILLHVLVFMAPVLSIRLPSLLQLLRPGYTALVLVVSAGLSYYFFKDVFFPAGNVFINMSVGATTFYEDLTCGTPEANHNWSLGFHWFFMVLRYSFSALSLFVLILMFVYYLKNRQKTPFSPLVLFSWLSPVAYLALLMITEGYFDRYHIPLFASGAVLFALNTSKRIYKEQFYFSTAAIAVYITICVCGTRDYFTINRLRWKAYEYLQAEHQARSEKVHAGFETKGWNDGQEYVNMYDFNGISGNDYLVQYRAEPGFSPIKSYPFKRFFPPRNDTIFAFKRVE